jgi:benzoyl-CoA reductase/2-hydroxyglutaryl-CoA dehydratase subunit BcrC/BadD/HgdB
MPCVAYNSAYIPPEWIAAHRLQPCRPVLDEPPSHAQPISPSDGCCSWAQNYIEQICGNRDVSAAIIVMLCDQVRRASEKLVAQSLRQGPAVMLFHLPATCQTPSAKQYYRDELRRLGQFLEEQGGVAPSPEYLRAVMLQYEQRRERIRSRAHTMRGRERADAIAELYGNPHNGHGKTQPTETHASDDNGGGVPVALLGSEVPRYQWWLYDVIEQQGGRVALDATDYGERGMPGPYDLRLMGDDPFEAMASVYCHIPHIRQRPNDRLYAWLAEQLLKRDVQGVILRRSLWCDLWHGEVARIKATLPLPVLDVDLEVDATTCERAKGRIAAFMEVLR